MPSYAITGASRGIGYGFVTALSKIPGNTVFALVRNKAATEKKLADEGINNVQVVVADLTDAAGLDAAAAVVAKSTGGSLDFLINNAAALPMDQWPLDQYPHNELDKIFGECFTGNVNGVAHTINAFLPLIRQGQAKKVITISSSMADIYFVNDYDLSINVAYSVSKAAANALVAQYNALLGKKEGILFLSLSPGAVDTAAGRPPLTEKETASFMELAVKLQGYAPDFKGPISVEESVEKQLKVIHEATVQTSGGAFVSHSGNKRWL